MRLLLHYPRRKRETGRLRGNDVNPHDEFRTNLPVDSHVRLRSVVDIKTISVTTHDTRRIFSDVPQRHGSPDERNLSLISFRFHEFFHVKGFCRVRGATTNSRLLSVNLREGGGRGRTVVF